MADVAIVPAPNVITHENASRKIDIQCEVKAGADLGQRRAGEVEAKVRKGIKFDREYHPEFLGEFAAREESRRRLLALSALSLLGVLLIIHSDFKHGPPDSPGLPDTCRSP